MIDDYETWDMHFQEHEIIYEEIEKLRKIIMVQAIIDIIIIIFIIFIVLTLAY